MINKEIEMSKLTNLNSATVYTEKDCRYGHNYSDCNTYNHYKDHGNLMSRVSPSLRVECLEQGHGSNSVTLTDCVGRVRESCGTPCS